ncbi:MAG: acetolactate synthase small subunit [Eubacteriales bacterium]
MQKYIIAVLVSNTSGVLTRVSSLFTRRGFNIDSLTVGRTENPDYSRMTITFSGDEYDRSQVLKQLAKLHDVKVIKEMLPDKAFARELVIMKVSTDGSSARDEVFAAISAYKAKQLDYTAKAISVELTGESGKIDAFIEEMRPYGILELCRTGTVAMDRGLTRLCLE